MILQMNTCDNKKRTPVHQYVWISKHFWSFKVLLYRNQRFKAIIMMIFPPNHGLNNFFKEKTNNYLLPALFVSQPR